MRRPRPLVLHPLLFAALPVVYLYAANLAETNLSDVLAPLAVILVGAVILLAAAAFLLRRIHAAGVAVSGLILLFFSYGHVHRGLAGTPVGRHRVLLVLWAALALVLVVAAVRGRRWLVRATGALNFVAAGLVLVNVATIALYNLRSRPAEVGDPGIAAAPRTAPDRDIYYLVFDRYGGERALRGSFRFDNSTFVEGLEKRGFYVADRSSGNYPRTLHSLASSLNMDHLLELARRVGEDSGDGGPLREILADHRVGRFLKEAGYRYIQVGSWWAPTATSPLADRTMRAGLLSEFSAVLLSTTAAAPVLEMVSGEMEPRRREYNRTLQQFENLTKASRLPGPKFVFAHFLVPHTPYVFDRNGAFLPQEIHDARSEGENYVEQLRYVNRRIEQLLDEILAVPEKERPIVLLQSDEGPGERPESWEGVPQRVLEEKFFILNAYHLPGVEDPPLYPTITPVNSFRLVLNLYFGAELPLLPDRVYVFQDIDHLYRFTDVTERLFGDDP